MPSLGVILRPFETIESILLSMILSDRRVAAWQVKRITEGGVNSRLFCGWAIFCWMFSLEATQSTVSQPDFVHGYQDEQAAKQGLEAWIQQQNSSYLRAMREDRFNLQLCLECNAFQDTALKLRNSYG